MARQAVWLIPCGECYPSVYSIIKVRVRRKRGNPFPRKGKQVGDKTTSHLFPHSNAKRQPLIQNNF